MDFNFVTSRIAVGAAINSKADLDELVAQGITHVLDMRAEFDDTTLNDPAVTILWLPQQDDGTPRPVGHYRRGVQFAYQALSLPESNKVLCHCAAGVNRGPTMCYALLRAFGFDQPTAIQMIRTVRPQVGFYTIPNYLQSVEQDLLLP
jgi:protein-tyrosine phosphatase